MQELVATALSPLVGRERELAALERALANARLVTITGPGGVGKTRLAAAFLERRAESVTAVELAPLRVGEHVLPAVLATFGVRHERGVDPVVALRSALGDEPRILVLDNCEHVRAAVVQLATVLLHSCRRLRVLATSRRPLRIPGEEVFTTPPLSVGRGGDATKLFVDRAARASDAFSPDANELAQIDLLCAALDGLPLAIELAAARVRALGLEDLLDPQRRLDMAACGVNDVPRHVSLRASVDWSYELLNDAERTLFKRLSVFAGGWQLAAAEAVCADGDLPREQILDVLSTLVDRSLVSAERTHSGQVRFGMLATVRNYAEERLTSSGNGDRVRAAHAQWCARIAASADEALVGRGQLHTVTRLDQETENLRAGLAWASTADSVLGVRIASSLPLYWAARGRLAEGRAALEVLQPAARAGEPKLRSQAFWALGLVLVGLGELRAAEPVVEAAKRAAEESGDERLRARALNLCGRLDLFRDPLVATAPFEQAIALAEQAHDNWCLADSLGKLGAIHLYRGDGTAAAEPFRRALELARDAEDGSTTHRALGGLARVALFDGRPEDGAGLLRAALAVSRALGDRNWIAIDMAMLGELERVAGRVNEGRASLEAALALAQEIGASYPIYLATGLLGRIALAEGRTDVAAQLFADARDRGERDGLRPYAAWWQLGLAEIALDRGEVDGARACYQAALRTAEALGNTRETAAATAGLGSVALATGDHELASAHFARALAAQHDIGDRAGARRSLELLIAAARSAGQDERAGRIETALSAAGRTLDAAVALALRSRG